MKDNSNMEESADGQDKTIYSDGFCPQCLLDGDHQEMTLNDDDFWECPKCRVQAHSASFGMFAILDKRGRGSLRTDKATSNRQVIGSILTRGRFDSSEGPVADPRGFLSEKDVRDFLTTIQ